ncbi:MAG: NADH-quinone oxidoreductase subunit E [Bacteroidetes bacterium]|nr:MAG: NADH-quinone oxidoreductase subunit E [Bacteroidota bacterium]
MSNNNLRKVDVIFSPYSVEPYDILKKVKQRKKEDVIQELIDSGLRGRGGAGFPTGLKWKFAAQQKSDQKYVICNADEGEPGTFKDRKLLVEVPRKVISGMAICAWAVGATKGFIYLRREYRYLIPELEKEIKLYDKYAKDIELDFTIEIFLGAGAYVCGEETALIESMEGKRGEPRNKPPYPIQEGYLGKPTTVNNVETLASATMVCRIGADEYKSLGTDDQHGSKLFSISGDSPKEGVHELELGMSVEDFANEFGDGDTKAVQVGGVAGFCIPRKQFKSSIIGEGNTTGGSTMIFNSTRSMYNVLHNYLDFYAEESCGQCTPCRIGTQQLLKGIEAVKAGTKPPEYLDQLSKLAETMRLTSKCGLGQSVTNSFSSIVKNFREEMIF